jgi:hypothetical protein
VRNPISAVIAALVEPFAIMFGFVIVYEMQSTVELEAPQGCRVIRAVNGLLKQGATPATDAADVIGTAAARTV